MAGRVLDLLRPRSPFLSLRLMEGQRVWIAAQRGISSKRPGTVARVPGGNGAGRRHRRDQQSFAVVNHMRASDQVRAITTPGYRNQFICYARTVAYSSGSAMLFSSGDSPQHASSILSGEGFERGASRRVTVRCFCSMPLAYLARFSCATGLNPQP